VKTPEDVRQHVGAPLLAVVPQTEVTSRDKLVLLDPAGKGPFPEGYRVLRTALSYCWPAGGPRVISVSSTLPREGKTLTAVNLALALAARDGNVLLMDGDLRRPQLHSVLRVKRAPGLADILTGKAKPSETIQRVPGTSLSVMPSGGHVPSPADLMSAGVLKGLIEGLRGYYAWVVVDTAPIGAVPDALVFAPLTDGLIVVVGSEMVHRNAVVNTIERIGTTGARILGVVLNHADVARHSYYYGQYYGHYAGHYYGTDAGLPGRAPLRAVRAGRDALP
jgi:receptor protein-tyrosine kinase